MNSRRSHVLSCACALVLAAANSAASAQQAPNTRKTAELEEVVVTGSLIAGTPEDSALPVEVITEEELDNLGRPSNLDLVKTMSEVGQVAGEANRYNGYPGGAATINLRNIGSRFTTVIFNGRRFPEQYSVTTGRFNNISWIPNAAIGSIEILKEGGAATYGADAVGGVVNYLTKRNVNGLEVSGDYRYIKDSDGGDYNADALWGKTFSGGNFMVVAGYQHRSLLWARDRDWAIKSGLENPTLSASGSPGAYSFMTTASGGTGTINPAAAAGLNRYIGDRHASASFGIVRDPQCNALGGFAGWSATPSPVCYNNVVYFEPLVNESDSYQLYSELNVKFGESMEFHGEGLYYQLDSPNIPTYPGDAPASFPLLTSRVTTPGDTFNLRERQYVGTNFATGSAAYFTDGHNPAVAQFLSTFSNSPGSTVATAYTPAQIAAITNGGRAALITGTWRPFGLGGNPLYGETDSQHNNSKLYRITTELKGDLPKFLGTDLQWDTALTYSRVDYLVATHDILVDRLQSALNGLGGANCNGIRADLAGSTCQWFNPFSSAIARNPYTGAINMGHVPALANSVDLVRWLYVPIELDRHYDNIVFDALVRGNTGIALPGGPIAMALGMQYRYSGEEFVVDDLSNRDINPCATIGVQDCAVRTGPLAYTRNATVLGTTQNSRRHYPVVAAFFETQLPLLDTLNVQLAGRYEKFYSDVTDRDNSVFVPALALKWQPINWLAMRVSGGKTFSQVNPPQDDGQTITNVGTPNNTFGGITGYQTVSYDNVDVKPEKGTYLDLGMIIQAGAFSSNIDYFDIRVDDYTRTMTANNVLRALVGPSIPGQAFTLATPLRCDSGLFSPVAALGNNSFVTIPGGCTQGVTTLAALNNNPGARINFFGGVGQSNSGQLRTRGVDFSAGYRFDNALGGVLRPAVDLTYNLSYKLDPFIVAGVVVADGYDGLGYANGSTGRLGIAVPKWRGSFSLNYSRDIHTLNVAVRYIPSVINEDPSDFDASNDQNANIGDANGFTTTAGGACTVPGVTNVGLMSDVGNVPANAGTGVYGTTSVGINGSALTGLTATTRGFCGTQNTSILSGQKVAASTNVDLTYRLRLESNLEFSLTIYNLLDEEPSFARAQVPYNSGFGSPLERNFKLGIRKKF